MDRELMEREEQGSGKRAVAEKTGKSGLGRWAWRHKKPLAVLALVLAVVLLAGFLRSSWARQREMEREMALQKDLIEALQKETQEDEDEGLVHEGTPEITSQRIGEELNSLRELVTKEYLYTNADQYENRSQVTIRNWDIDIPLTGKSFLLAYDGRIKAGVDLSRAQVEVDGDRETVTVTLPASEIVSHEIFEDDIRVFNERDSLFNKITIDNYNEFVSEQKEIMEQKAVDMGLLTGASQEARESLRAFLELMPGMDGYRLEIR